jgi:superfamily II RNA helicase
MLHPSYGPYLYFVFSRRSAEACARDLGKYADRCLLDEGQERRMRDRLRTAIDEIGTEVLDPDLYDLYAKGIAFHHAGLHVQLKALVEDLYESKLLMVLYTTSTFALGINMPARSVVLDDIHKYDGRGTRPLTTREFMQKAGRAGRRGMDKKGHVVVRLDFDNYEEAKPHLERYMRGKPEEVRSSFNLSFNSIVNLTERMDDEQVRELLDRSFLAYRLQQASVGLERQADKLEGKLQREGWNPEEPGRGPPEMRRKAKELRRLRKRQAKGMSRVWADFLHRRQFLTQIGYLGEDGQPGAGANLLKHIQIEEIFTTELALSGLVDTLSPEILFGVLCGMTNSLAPTVRLRDKLYGDARKVAKKINDIRFSDPVTGAERITGIEATWDPDLIAFGVQWAEGRTLSEISLLYWSNTDISGQLVSGFRRAKDLASQLRQVFREDEILADRLSELMRRVSRDEVEVVD